MQEREKEEKQPFAPTDSQSQPLPNIPLAQGDEESDDPDAIFRRAVTEIDTQPLKIKSDPFTIGEVVEICFLVFVLCLSFMGIVWQCITYPHTLVILYTKAKPASITATLDASTRTLAPITLTRSATATTTGTGHREAKTATGQVTFYNGLSIEQSVPAGTKLTGSDGEQIITDQTATIPPNAPPEDGYVTIPAHALHSGERGNVAAYDVAIALSSSLTVKNLAAFTGGRDARTFKAVAAQDLRTLTTTLNTTLTQAFTTAFTLQPGEAAIPTNCTTKTTRDHQPGDEAQSVTLTMSKTCSAVAYDQGELTRAATAAFTKTRPGANYHIVGNIETSLKSFTPFIVALNGKWAYTFSQNYQEFLAQGIQRDTPEKAKAYLLKTGVISYASVPNTLASADYINFLVLVG